MQTNNSKTYNAVSVYDKDKIAVISATNFDLENRNDECQVNFWHKQKWFTTDLSMSCISVITWKDEYMIAGYLSYDGIFIIDDGENDAIAEILDDTDFGPSELVQMRKVRCIDNSLFAVGMSRLVYKKELPNGIWHKIDKNIFVPREERIDAVGLNDIVSNGKGGLLTVGYKGEIWQMKNDTWKLENSPTNVNLSSIAKHPDKEEFTIVGLSGNIIQGNPTTGWNKLNLDSKLNFWSVVYFKNAIYIASDQDLFTIENNILKNVNLGSSEIITTRFLDCCDKEIVSVGDNHIFSSTNGIEWIQLPNT